MVLRTKAKKKKRREADNTIAVQIQDFFCY